MPEITDLDVLVPEPKTVKFGGAEYPVPADMPMEIFLRVNQAATYKNEDGSDDQVRQIQSLLDALTDLLVWEQPEGDVTDLHAAVQGLLKKRGVKFCFELIQNIYKDDDEAAEQQAEENPTPPASGEVLPAEV